MMNLKNIKGESVVNSIVNQIMDSLLNEELRPGDKLPTEVEMMEQLGVGRNSVREAIKMLSALGVLEIRRGQGTFIVNKVPPEVFNPVVFGLIVEPKTYRDLYEFRSTFDISTLLILTERINDKQIEELQAILDRAVNLYEENVEDIDRYVELDLLFHRKLIEFTNNPLILTLGDVIYKLFKKYIRKSISQEHGRERSIENHTKIISLLKERKKEDVIKIAEITLKEWKENWNEKMGGFDEKNSNN